MSELTLNNIDKISSDIRREEISFSHLLEDLIDHVCCDVEYEMQKGMNFSDAYHRVKQKMGPRRLKEIQEETLYSVDTKYRYMKNTMKISGVAGTILFGFAALFKIQHWPGAGIMMSLGALILAFVFLPSALSVLWKETHNKRRLFLFISAFFAGLLFIFGTVFKIQHWPLAGILLTLSALSGILFFIPALTLSRSSDLENKAKRPVYILGAAGIVFFIAGLLFKIQHWPLATLFMITGIFLLFFLSLPMYTWITWKEENHIRSMFIYLVIGSVLIIVPGAMLNLNLQRDYLYYYFPNNNQQNSLYDYLIMNNNALISNNQDSLSGIRMKQMHSKTIGMIETISNIQDKMVRESEDQTVKPSLNAGQAGGMEAGREIVYTELQSPFDTRSAKNVLMPECSIRKELNSAMAEYVSYLSGFAPAEDLNKYKKMLDADTFLPTRSPMNAEISLMSGLHSLEIMKNGLLTVESCILNKIVRQ